MQTLIKEDSQGQRRTYYIVNCAQCQTEIHRLKNEIRDKNFCSRDCFSKNTQTELTCAFCQKKFNVKNSSLHNSRSGVRFCSRHCKDEAQKLKHGFKFQTQYKFGERAYRSIAFREHPNKCNNCGYSKILDILQVHHKDRNRQNNYPSNLEILCPNCHSEEHFLKRDGWWT